MNVEDDRIDIYDKNFDISYIDLNIFIKYPIKFRVKNMSSSVQTLRASKSDLRKRPSYEK